MIHSPLRKTISFAGSGLLLLLMTACPPPPPRGVVYVREAPPREQVEVIGTAPSPEFVWIAGHHTWTGGVYVWSPGHWERRPHARARWVRGHWRHGNGGWYWVEGHWKY